MSYLHDEIDDGPQHRSAYNAPSRELTLSTPAILGIFFGLALLDRGAEGQQIVVVPKCHLNGVVERNLHSCWILGQNLCLLGRRRRTLGRRGLRTCSPGKEHRDEQNWKPQTL